MKSKILVFIQFFCIFLLIFLNTSYYKIFSYQSVILILGITIGTLAILENKLHNFNIRPDIKDDADLITTGIYYYIKHPMYSSVLLTMLAIVLIKITYISIIIYIVLLVNIIIKMFYEEKLWNNLTKEYKIYSEKTYRLIPLIF